MKQKMCMLMAALSMMAAGLQSCNDDEPLVVPSEVQKSFTQMFPGEDNAGWGTRAGHYVASFKNSGNNDVDAWFSQDGQWWMTETDIPFNALPAAIQATFEASEYAAWKVDDVDMLERNGLETVYVVEVERGEQEMDLYFNINGVLFKEVADDDDNSEHYLPESLTETAKAFLESKYPDSQMLEIDRTKEGLLEVEIVFRGEELEITFDANGNWMSTAREVREADVPKIVRQAAIAEYPGYEIDDINLVETPAAVFYAIEMEKDGAADVVVLISADGNVIK